MGRSQASHAMFFKLPIVTKTCEVAMLVPITHSAVEGAVEFG